MLAALTLAGVRIDAAPPPLAEVLPRMDVAVFVGFAAAGPTHRPVAVESVAQFAAVFGHDAALAWDGESGERIYANLGASVRAFFSNGGRRCWVIRVARTAALEARWRGPGAVQPLADVAAANQFAVPGVLAVSAGADAAPSITAARVQARSVGAWSDDLRLATALAVTGFAIEDCAALGAAHRVGFATRATLRAGDLIELGDPAAATPAPRLFATVDRAVTTAGGGAPLRVEATLCAAFAPLRNDAQPHVLGGFGFLTVPGLIDALVPAILERRPGEAVDVRVHFETPATASPTAGYWACWSDGDDVLWVRIDAVAARPADFNATQLVIAADGAAWRQGDPSLPMPAPRRAAVLTLDLRAGAADESFRMTGVGLTPAHAAAWWRQVSDDRRYADSDTPVASAGDFPLAALDAELDQSPALAWLPLGVGAVYGDAVAPLPQTASALERDGLSRFDAELFLDPELAALGSDVLIAQADVIRYFADAPRPLFGMHAALSIGTAGLYNEASLLAVPDAQQVGWTRRTFATPLAPSPAAPKAPPHWLTHRGACAPVVDAALTGPDAGAFLDCDTRRLTEPMLVGPALPVRRGSVRLSWSAAEPDCTYVLREAQQPDFADARDVFRGTELGTAIAATREGVFYYTVHAVAADERSAESNAIAVEVRDEQWTATPAAAFAVSGEGELLRLHRAALQLAAATGELFVALGLPRHYRAPDAVRYAARLRAQRSGDGTVDARGLALSDRRALSYGALFHPWVAGVAPAPGDAATVDARGALRVCPPDGLVSGVLAARAVRRGAWVAAANEPFRDVFALAPPMDAAAWPALLEARVNLLLDDPRGFLTRSATTLADELELEPINVRRLLILLRRLALRRGANYVFEPNGDLLRRAVERGFGVLLADLFRRGAFAGATPAESFRIAVDAGGGREGNRLVVELRVAPALPLQFLTVRLVQSGERFSVNEEV